MSTDVLAWLTDNTASTHEAAEILQPLGVSIVSPSATAASLLDNPTFFRTIQGDGTTAIAIVKLCKTLGFNFIQVRVSHLLLAVHVPLHSGEFHTYTLQYTFYFIQVRVSHLHITVHISLHSGEGFTFTHYSTHFASFR